MRKIKHKRLESEMDSQEVLTDKNQDTSRKRGGKEKKKKAKKKNTPKRKKQSDSNNNVEESLGNVPKKARKEMQINPSSRPDQDSDAKTIVDDSSLKENEKDTRDKDHIQETENDITQEEPEDSNPTSNKTDPPEPTNPNPGATPEPTTEPNPKPISQHKTPRKDQESTMNRIAEAPNNDSKESSKDLQKDDFSTPKKKGDKQIGSKTVYYGADGRKQFRNLDQERKLLSESVKHDTNQKNFYSWLGKKNDQLNKRCQNGSRN